MKREQSKGIAFQVLRNGRRVCSAGLGGKAGVLTVILDYVKRQDREELSLHVGGLESGSQEHILWTRQALRIGDEVVVVVAENVIPTRVRARVRISKKSPEDQEKAWLRRTAKRHGYKLVKR